MLIQNGAWVKGSGVHARRIASHTQTVYTLCMASKTISLSVEAYERLRRARRSRGESFSQVVMRAAWPEVRVTAGELLERLHAEGPFLDEIELDRIEAANRADTPPEDKWRAR